MQNWTLLLLGFVLVFFNSCKTYQADTFTFQKQYNTYSNRVIYQNKTTYCEAGVCADNLFDGARLNGFRAVAKDTFQAIIKPEITPIINSPWFAFRLKATHSKKVVIALDFQPYESRYIPKIGDEKGHWKALEKTAYSFNMDTSICYVTLSLSSKPTYLAAQKVQNSQHVKKWSKTIAKHSSVKKYRSIGKSPGNRDLRVLDIYEGKKEGKDIIVLLGRQHPPEVTGYFAMQDFMEALLSDNELAKRFRAKYRVLALPLLNPDGVDLGHWRYNTGGVDMNLDWASYNQTENRLVADYLVTEARRANSRVVLGIDFHSMWYDIFYTNKVNSHLPRFKYKWIKAIQKALPKEKIKEVDSGIVVPMTQDWFFKQFKAEAMTYEVGDETDRGYIQKKAVITARTMMQLLEQYSK